MQVTLSSDFCYNSELFHVQKFVDDTAIVGCIRGDSEEEYRSLVRDFVVGCHTNHPQRNTSKTKELVIDYGKPRPCPGPVQIKGAIVENVVSYKYLGCGWTTSLIGHATQIICTGKPKADFTFLRRPQSFNIYWKLLWLFLQSVVASVLFYAVVCWGAAYLKRTH